MSELITPAQSEMLIQITASALSLLGAGLGWKVFGRRGVLLGAAGPLVYALWQFHKWMTRFDPHSGYFGLDRVWVFSLEVLLFVCLGVLLGFALRKTARSK